MDLFVTCSKDLEQLLADELGSLGYTQGVVGFRGVSLRNVHFDDIYRINYQSRIAGRVLLPLANFRVFDSKTLYKGALGINWQAYIPAGKTISIDANVSHPNLRNSLFAAQVMKDAICDQLKEKRGERPSVNTKNPDIQLNLYINDNKATISFDTSGDSLGKRGYRQESVEAPIQENLAAAILRMVNYKGEGVFCDPCCGSGTFLIEAALIASKTAPGYLRADWGFFNLPEYTHSQWLKVKAEIDSQRISLPENIILGCDINKQCVHACKVNLRAAGFHRSIHVEQCDIREFSPHVAPTLIVTNPPYGRRLDDVDHLYSLYRAIGDFMKVKTAGNLKPNKGYVLTYSSDLAKEVGLTVTKRHVIYTGGLEARLLEFDLF